MTDAAEAEVKRLAEALGEMTPPVPVAMTFDINWKDGDRSPVMFPGILGSNIEDGLLKLYGPDDEAHIVNMDVVSHINIWRHP